MTYCLLKLAGESERQRPLPPVALEVAVVFLWSILWCINTITDTRPLGSYLEGKSIISKLIRLRVTQVVPLQNREKMLLRWRHLIY